ncbi:hypothetical protein AALC25_00305 [Lachnospiraceae bacterium 29-84]
MNDMDSGYNDIPDYCGYCPDCPQCGKTMGYSYNKSEFKCPQCGYMMDEDEWEPEREDDGIPWGCQNCGGPYPQCITSCKLFDD